MFSRAFAIGAKGKKLSEGMMGRLSIHDTKTMNFLLEPNGWQNIVRTSAMKNYFDLSQFQ